MLIGPRSRPGCTPIDQPASAGVLQEGPLAFVVSSPVSGGARRTRNLHVRTHASGHRPYRHQSRRGRRRPRALIRTHEIAPSTRLGQVYAWATVLTCLTGFGIFQHGGFGKPHALGILTLLLVGTAWAVPSIARRGRFAAPIATALWSFTFFLHLVPGVTRRRRGCRGMRRSSRTPTIRRWPRSLPASRSSRWH